MSVDVTCKAQSGDCEVAISAVIQRLKTPTFRAAHHVIVCSESIFLPQPLEVRANFRGMLVSRLAILLKASY